MRNDLTLAVFAKPPVPGRVKTRLCPPLDLSAAAGLYAAFVQDTVRKAARTGTDPTVFYADRPDELRTVLSDAGPSVVSWRPQGEGDLGARLSRVPAPCVVLGTDSPHLPTDYVRQAFDALRAADVVLGPAEDGGYYLVALRSPHPALFEGIAWSTDRVLAQTQEKASGIGLTVALLPPWYDIDTIDDLRRLRSDLAGIPPGSKDDCPATRAILTALPREL